jgi:uncharacterized membrane protein SirB2
MIWFACKQCGKVHGRPEHSIGAMIFCDCGQGLTVPWESTAPEPPNAAALEAAQTAQAAAQAAAQAPKTEPLNFDLPAPSRRPMPEPPARTRRARRGRGEPDPTVCFNHDTLAKQHVCPECDLSFCDACVTTFRGRLLCGPCKNYEAKLLQRAPRVSGWALVSVMLALLTALFVFWVGRTGYWLPGSLFLVQAFVVLAGFTALRRIDRDHHLGGRSQAITGIVIGALVAVIAVMATLTVQRWQT